MNGSPEADAPAQGATPEPAAGSGGAAQVVAGGILLSRIAGLIRERIFAHYFGASLFADVFKMALRAPNILQNLLGEGVLSASFIPVYSELLAQGRREEAGRMAGAVFALLVAIAGVITLIGVAGAPLIVSIFTPGFEGLRREYLIICVRIIFPMTATLVLSAWALGVLNSHRRFFVPYFAPVLWNGALIATMLVLGGRMELNELVVALAWGALAGGLLQFAVQLPFVLRCERRLRIRPDLKQPGVRTALRNAGPAIAGRGVVQVSSYIDVVLVSFLGLGAPAALTYAQTLYVLPVSLFGMSIAAAELPELSRGRTGDAAVLGARIRAAARRMAVFVVPSLVAYIVIGDVLVAALYRTGRFGGNETLLVWAILAAYSLGLMASTATRLYSSGFFALHDTRTPAKAAGARVLLAAAVGGGLMFALRDVPFAGYSLGAVGLAFGAGTAAWLEWLWLRRSLHARLGEIGAGRSHLLKLFGAALIAAGMARAALLPLPETMPLPEAIGPVVVGAIAVAVFGVVYFAVAGFLGVEEAVRVVRRVLRR